MTFNALSNSFKKKHLLFPFVHLTFLLHTINNMSTVYDENLKRNPFYTQQWENFKIKAIKYLWQKIE